MAKKNYRKHNKNKNYYTGDKNKNRKQIRIKKRERKALEKEKSKQKIQVTLKQEIPIQSEQVTKEEIVDLSKTVIRNFKYDLLQYPSLARQVIQKWARNTENQIGSERFAQLVQKMYEKGILNSLYQYASDEEALYQVLTDLLDETDIGELEKEIIEEAIEQDQSYESYD